jgi:hypothetical protein
LCQPAQLGDVDHPPAAVAGDIDIEAGHWSLPDEAVGVLTHEHEISQAPVQRSSGHAIVAAVATPARGSKAGRPARCRQKAIARRLHGISDQAT